MEKKGRYNRFSKYLKERFGCRVYKVSIDAGFSCPNKDGKLSKDGCIYCDNRAFSFNTRISPGPIKAQIEQGMSFARERYGAEKFIVYFQSCTNTYAPLEVLKKRYDIIREFEDIVGISISTRPDCVNGEILDLIEDYSREYEVWIEYGLQSIHNETLELINRQHLYRDFLKAFKQTRKRKKINICVHVIIGLPGETKEKILATAKELGRFKLEGIKIHPLHIIKGTKLYELWQAGRYRPLELDTYVEIVTGFLEYLRPNTVIQRISADCPEEFLAAPLWIREKTLVLNMIDKKLAENDTFQGAKRP